MDVAYGVQDTVSKVKSFKLRFCDARPCNAYQATVSHMQGALHEVYEDSFRFVDACCAGRVAVSSFGTCGRQAGKLAIILEALPDISSPKLCLKS